MRQPTALLIPSPWSGDEYDPVPRSYRWWSRLYVTTRRARHHLGLHDYGTSSPHVAADWDRCTWCGKIRHHAA